MTSVPVAAPPPTAPSPPAAPEPERVRSLQARVAATSFLALFAIVGLALYGLPFYYDFMVRDFGWTRAQVTSGNAYSKLLVGPLFGFFAGWIVDRFGPRRLMIAGILMAGTALVGLGSINSLTGFYVFYLFNAIGYVCGGPLPNQVLLSRWFTRARGRAMGFAYLGIGLGGALVPLLSVWLVRVVGWHGALMALGGLIIVIALPLALVVKESPPAGGAAAHQPTPSGAVNAHITGSKISLVLRSPAFYLLLVGSMCSIAAVGGTNQHLKLFLSLDHGFTQGAAARVVSLVLAASLVGRLGMGWLADRVPKKYVMLLIYLLVASGIPLLFLAQTPGMLYVFAIVFGLGLGGEYMVIPLVAAELFGVAVLGRAMGIVLTADGVAEAVAPMLVGRMRDVSGSYLTGFGTLIGFALVGAVAISMLPRRSGAKAPAKPTGAKRRREQAVKSIGVIMNGVTGRMGLNQHLVRSIVAIRAQGGVSLANGDRLVPDPILVGRDESRLREIAAAHGIERVSTDLDACLANPADAIYFDATLTNLRAGHVRRAIAAGKHVYCEKPLATTTTEALELAQLARHRGVKHGVVQDKLFLPGIRKLKRLVDSGFFGRILSVRGDFGYWVFEGDWGPPAQRPSWNYRREDGGGIIVDMFAHWRYVLDHTFGQVRAVQCLGATHIPERVDEHGKRYAATADDAAYATFVLQGSGGRDIVAQFNSSWTVRVYRDELLQIQVDGTHGSAVAGLRECRIQDRASTPRPVWNPDVPNPIDFYEQWRDVNDDGEFDNAFKVQWEKFFRHVVDDEPFVHDFVEGAKGVQLAELALESWAERRWIDVPPLAVLDEGVRAGKARSDNAARHPTAAR